MAEAAPNPLTPSWLLASGSFPSPPSSVCEEALPAEGEDEGVNSICTLVAVSCQGGHQTTCVAKRAVHGPALGACLAQRWLEREYKFYTDVVRFGPLAAPAKMESPAEGLCSVGRLRVPVCKAAQWAQGPRGVGRFLLLLERLASPEWQRADPAEGCSMEQALAAVTALGHFHSCFANEALLANLQWLPLTAVHVEFGTGVQQYFAEGYTKVRQSLSQLLSDAALTSCDRLCSAYSELLARLAQPPWTLVHGDFRLENLRFSVSGTPEVAAFDWQFVHKGRGGYDLAYFLALSAPPEQRRDREKELLERYLEARGGQLERAALEEEMRVSLLLVLASFIMGVLTASPSTHEMHRRGIQWLGCAVDDWGCSSCLGTGTQVS